MAALATQEVVQAGLAPSYGAAAGGGDTFTNDGATFLHVKNAGASPITVTITSSGTYRGAAFSNQTVTVPNAGERMIKPYAPEVTGATAAVGYSGVTSVTVAAVKFTAP